MRAHKHLYFYEFQMKILSNNSGWIIPKWMRRQLARQVPLPNKSLEKKVIKIPTHCNKPIRAGQTFYKRGFACQETPTWWEQKKWCRNRLVPTNLSEKLQVSNMAKGTPGTPSAVLITRTEGQPILAMLPTHLLPPLPLSDQILQPWGPQGSCTCKSCSTCFLRHPRSLLVDGQLDVLEQSCGASSSEEGHHTVFKGQVFWLFVLTEAGNIPPKN